MAVTSIAKKLIRQITSGWARFGRPILTAGRVRDRPRSRRIDIGDPNDFTPLRDFFGDKLGKLGGRTANGTAAHIGKPLLHLGIGQDGVDLTIELADDRSRRVLRRTNSVPNRVASQSPKSPAASVPPSRRIPAAGSRQKFILRASSVRSRARSTWPNVVRAVLGLFCSRGVG